MLPHWSMCQENEPQFQGGCVRRQVAGELEYLGGVSASRLTVPKLSRKQPAITERRSRVYCSVPHEIGHVSDRWGWPLFEDVLHVRVSWDCAEGLGARRRPALSLKGMSFVRLAFSSSNFRRFHSDMSFATCRSSSSRTSARGS